MAGWANSLSAGEIDSSLEYGFFMVAVELTDIGQGKLPSWFQPKGHVFYWESLNRNFRYSVFEKANNRSMQLIVINSQALVSSLL